LMKNYGGGLEAYIILRNDHKGAIVPLNNKVFGVLKMKKTTTREASQVRIVTNEMLEE